MSLGDVNPSFNVSEIRCLSQVPEKGMTLSPYRWISAFPNVLFDKFRIFTLIWSDGVVSIYKRHYLLGVMTVELHLFRVYALSFKEWEKHYFLQQWYVLTSFRTYDSRVRLRRLSLWNIPTDTECFSKNQKNVLVSVPGFVSFRVDYENDEEKWCSILFDRQCSKEIYNLVQ